jgi:hypothetical protein
MSFFTMPSHRSEQWAFQMAHVDLYYSARAEPEVRQFETALYSAVF